MSPGHIFIPPHGGTFLPPSEAVTAPWDSLFHSGSFCYAGGHGGVDIPVPVPNTEVKHPRADDTPFRGKVGSRRLFLFKARAVGPPSCGVLPCRVEWARYAQCPALHVLPAWGWPLAWACRSLAEFFSLVLPGGKTMDFAAFFDLLKILL